jgi:DNA-binding MarR family transcriptional regulator
MRDLALLLDVQRSTVTRVCDRLVEKALLTRRPHGVDGRSVCAHLTARGRRVVEQSRRRRMREIDAVLQHLAPDHQRGLAVALAAFSRAAGEAADDAWALGWADQVAKG